MQRYTVTIVVQGHSQRPTLLIPCEPSAVVAALTDEVFRRAARNGLPSITADTHVANLHLDIENGPIIDSDDVLGDIVADSRNEKLFAVLTPRTIAPGQPEVVQLPISTGAQIPGAQDVIIRLITPEIAHSQSSAPTFSLPCSSTIQQLHERAAVELSISSSCAEGEQNNECNCSLARSIAASPDSKAGNFALIVHGKSDVQRVELSEPTEEAVMAATRQTLGQHVEAKKKLNFVGAVIDPASISAYTKAPVVAVCSKDRHRPDHTRQSNADIDTDTSAADRILDLHTSEHPISPGCMHITIGNSGLQSLAVDGIIDLFAVPRAASVAPWAPKLGRDKIFRSHAHWEPPMSQSDRGTAMFLSSLRVFSDVVEGMQADQKYQDAVLHVLDLLVAFPPAIRAFYVLIQGRTPTPPECAAISHALYHALNRFMPIVLVGADQGRLFEGSRLLFGFVLEKARSLKLQETEAQVNLPYLSALNTVDLRDVKTREPVMHAVQTSDGLIERSLYEALSENGLLSASPVQTQVTTADSDPVTVRVAMLSAGSTPELLSFSMACLASNYRYQDAGNASSAWDQSELSEMQHLSEFCGRNKLTVYRPRELVAARAPCLTFDRKAHLAVYNGEEACGEPGRSSLMFRPKHGTETVDTAVIEQLIAPILRQCEANGTAIFDALGGSAVRRLQKPDEILMFVVDCSASMRTSTDFLEVDQDQPMMSEIVTAASVTDPEYFNRASFEDMKDRLCRYECFEDMVAIVAETRRRRKRDAAKQTIELLRTMLASEIVDKHKDLEARRERARLHYHLRHGIADLDTGLDSIKTFWAGLQTHEEAVCDFLVFRASAVDADALHRRWTWSLGDAVPAGAPLTQLPSPAAEITSIPDDLRCPISHTLMLDAVEASDGHTYSRAEILRWFTIRASSPMHGLPLTDTSLVTKRSVCDAANEWMNGASFASNASSRRDIRVEFVSPVGTFERHIQMSRPLSDLYHLAFRGLAARYNVFQLARGNVVLQLASPLSVQAWGVRNGDRITIRIADETDLQTDQYDTPNTGICLVKVYERNDEPLFAYWEKRDTKHTVASVLWKFWRRELANPRPSSIKNLAVWASMTHSGDGLLYGHDQISTEMLSKLFDPQYCYGCLSSEPVYQEEDRNRTTAEGADQPLVLKLWLARPPRKDTNRCNDIRLSRLDVLKQMFEALVNRMLAYNYATHIGLVTIGSTGSVTQEISHVIEDFRRAAIDMVASGDTALWDSIALANDRLTQYATRYPEAKKRIIVISDGVDTKSITQKAHNSYWMLKQHGVALDSICLGSEDNKDLRTCCFLLGGYRFKPQSLSHALSICEMEPFLSLTERPPLVESSWTPRDAAQLLYRFRNATFQARVTVVDDETIPPRKEHPRLNDEFVPLQVAATGRRNVASSASSTSRSNLRISRLMNEMREIANGSHQQYDVYVSETDMSFWKVVMSGPDESPFAAGTFLLYLHADEGYPTYAPKARFVTKMKHPNINAHGRICHSIFDRDWTSDTSMASLLDTVFGLLWQPETTDPINTTTTLGYHHDPVEFATEVRDFVQRHARRDRAAWKAELLGEADT